MGKKVMLARSVWWCCKSNNITSRYFCPLLPPYHLLFVSVSKINQLLMTILILGGFKNHEGSKLTGSTSRCWDTSCVLNCSQRWPWLVAHDLRMTTNQRHRMFFLCHWMNFKSRTLWFSQIVKEIIKNTSIILRSFLHPSCISILLYPSRGWNFLFHAFLTTSCWWSERGHVVFYTFKWRIKLRLALARVAEMAGWSLDTRDKSSLFQ